jgi:excisionase family DNA binding protein
MISDKILYSMKEAAAQVSLSVSTLEQLVTQGEVHVRRIGKRILVPRKELERLATRDVEIFWPERKHPKPNVSAEA